MTKEQLEQYTSIKEEIKELEAELDKRKSPVSDIVTGSMEDYPYTQHGITVWGVSNDSYTLDFKLTLKKKELEQKRLEIEGFIDSIQDSETRRIIRLKYIKNMTWTQVAMRLGKQDEGTPRKKLEKFLSDSENSGLSGL